jgi:hypothetical protein
LIQNLFLESGRDGVGGTAPLESHRAVVLKNMERNAQLRSLRRTGKVAGAEMPVVCPVVTPELVGFVPDAVQESLLFCEEKQVILNCSRQWGKSSVTALRAAMVATRAAEATVVAMSPSARQSGEFLRKVQEFLGKAGLCKTGLGKLRTDGVNEMSILLPNGSRIIALPGVEGTMRGFSAVDLLIVDEAAQVKDGQYYAAQPMLAVKDGAVWLLSTPFGARGFFWKEWAMGGEGWVRIEAKATDCARLSAAFLARQRVQMSEDWYRQEYLCEFVGAENAPFRQELIEACYRDGVEGLF